MRSSAALITEISFAGDPASDDWSVAKAMDTALSQDGFMALRVPGLDALGVAGVRRTAAEFFARPDAEKLRFAYRDTKENFGYQPIGAEALDPSATADRKESFTMRDLARHEAERDWFPNLAFRNAALELHTRLTEVSHAVMHHLALALETERDFFRHGHSGRNMTLRFLDYPAVVGTPGRSEVTLGAGAHTDYGSFTLLLQDDVGGLQIRRDNAWIDVPADPDLVVVNTGDLMAHWSNDRWPSTKHRVRATTRRRASIAFFVDPDDETEVRCLRSCTRTRPPRYADTTAGEHILRKLNASQRVDADPRARP